ncbi:hypothetical protein BJX99DRAFT_228847 [Aspergillus californicus]
MLLIPVLVLGKCSIFLLYLQIFITDRTMKLGIWSGLIVTPIIYLPQLVLHAIYLAPRSGQLWGDLNQSETSDGGIAFGVVQASLTVLLDLYILVLPLPRIWVLQQPRSKRLQIMAVFSTAVMYENLREIVASVAGLVYRVRFLSKVDITYTTRQVFICQCAIFFGYYVALTQEKPVMSRITSP